MKELKDLCRENIWNLAPYSCARTEFAGRNARVFLDANENPYNDPYNRYPDPLQVELKKQISKIKGVAEEKIFLGNGSDEAIDLVYRVFCRPGKDTVEIAVQINGKTKGTLAIGKQDPKDEVIAKAKDVIADKLTGNIVKEIYVPGRIVNIVMK